MSKKYYWNDDKELEITKEDILNYAKIYRELEDALDSFKRNLIDACNNTHILRREIVDPEFKSVLRELNNNKNKLIFKIDYQIIPDISQDYNKLRSHAEKMGFNLP